MIGTLVENTNTSRREVIMTAPFKDGLITSLKILGAVLALLWGLEIVDFVLGGSLDSLGIRPRSVSGLLGILAAPFLHGGFGHLISNTIGFAILGGLVMAWGLDEWMKVTLTAALVGGVGTWLLGASNSVHIGASGVIFGYFGYLVLRGWFERKPASIALSLVVAWFYGSLIFGVFPVLAGPGISWEGHLFGFIGGALVARTYKAKAHATSARVA